MKRMVAAVGAAALVALLPAVPAHAAESYGEPINWQPCAEVPEVDCATVTVPVDWSNPGAEKIKIAVARRKATDPGARLGSLLMDPGGPGGPGAQLVKAVPELFSPDVHRRYDVIGFDPRGVGESSPVLCSDIGTQPPEDVTTEAEFNALKAFNVAYANNCRAHTGKVFDFVDTISVVRDMDAIRAGLGEHKLNYLGISYGTLMGQQYAEMFPERVGRFVLDSNMDHSLRTAWQFLRTETTAAEEIFDQYVDWCARTDGCALHGQDVRAIHHDLLGRAQRGELVIPGTDFKISPLRYLGAITGLSYGPDWFILAEIMRDLSGASTDPAAAARASEGMRKAQAVIGSKAGRGAAKRFGLGLPAGPGDPAQPSEEVFEDPFQAIFCSDWSLPLRSFGQVKAFRQELTRVAPDMTISPLGWFATTACTGLESRVRNPQHRLRIKGADPFLFINSRYDPATGYEWGTDSAHQAKQVLLTYDGWGHFAYPKSPCVTAATDKYLFTGELPARGTHCAAVEPVPPPGGPEARGAKPSGKLPLPVGPRPDVPGFAG